MEQKKMSKVYAVDFDGTLCENRWPEIGEANGKLIGYLIGRRQQAKEAAKDWIRRRNLQGGRNK